MTNRINQQHFIIARCFTIGIAFVCILGWSQLGFCGTTHNVFGRLFNSDGSVPADGDITFVAYITVRPNEKQTQDSPGAGYESGYWFVNVGNFPTAWIADEVLHVDFINTVNGETSGANGLEYTLTDGADEAPDFYLMGALSDISVQPASWDYGNVPIGNYRSKTFTVSNSGSGLLSVSGVGLVGDDAEHFSIASGGGNFNLNPSETHNIVVYFIPTSEGSKSATLDIESNVSGKSHLSIQLSGTGTPAMVLGDLDGDGKVSPFDATLILQYVVGLITQFPIELMATPEQSTPRNYELRVPELSVWEGERVRVPVIINNATGLTAGGVTLKYDTTVLRGIEVTPGALLSGYYAESRISDGFARIAFAGVRSQKRGGNLFYVEFLAHPHTSGRIAEIEISHAQLSNSTQVELLNGKIEVIPERTALLPNYPNPFNPETWIPYQLAKDATVTIRIYTSQGQLVRQLDLGSQKAGSYLDRERAAYWDGKNNTGQTVSSGLYFYHLKAGYFSATRRMVIVR